MNLYTAKAATINTQLNQAGASLTDPQRPPQVAESFAVLEKSLEALGMNCTELEKRLDCVLRHEPGAAGDAPREVPATVVGLAERLNESSGRVHQLNNQLASIVKRLEI